MDEDHKRAARFLLGKVNSLVPPTTHGSRTGPVGASLPLTMVIVDDQGGEIGMLDQLLQGMWDLVDDNARHRERVESLLAEVTLQGGVILDGLAFTAEAQVREVVMRECPKGDAFEVFLDPMSLWAVIHLIPRSQTGKRRHEPRKRTSHPRPGRWSRHTTRRTAGGMQRESLWWLGRSWPCLSMRTSGMD